MSKHKKPRTRRGFLFPLTVITRQSEPARLPPRRARCPLPDIATTPKPSKQIADAGDIACDVEELPRAITASLLPRYQSDRQCFHARVEWLHLRTISCSDVPTSKNYHIVADATAADR